MNLRRSTLWLPLLTAALVAAFAPPAGAQEDFGSNSRATERPAYRAWAAGRAAERAGKLEDAFADYSEAVREEPTSLEYLQRLQTVRYALSNLLVNQAEREILEDRLPQAAALLRKSLVYDPENSAAAERLRQLQRRTLQEITSLPEFESVTPQLAPRAGTCEMHYKGEARGAWEELAQQFGLLAVFEEDLGRREIRFRVPDVDFWTAARLLGEQTGTFLRAVDRHTFLVIEDTQQKRREYDPQIERTLLLPETEKPEQLNEMARAVRDIAGLTHAQLDIHSRSLSVRGPVRDVALATEMVRQLEQPRGELMLEIDVLEVDRNAGRNLGILPPSSAQIVTLSKSELQNAEQSTNGLVQLIEQLYGTPSGFGGASTQQIASLLGSGATSLSALIPGIIAIPVGRVIFLLTLPGATANFAANLSAVRSARRILLRAQDGEPASFFVGDRYPLSLSTLSNSLLAQQGPGPAITGEVLPVGASPRGILAATLGTGGSQNIRSITRANNTVTATLDAALTIPGGNGAGMVTVSGVTDTSFDGTFVVLTGSGTATLTWAQTGSNTTSSGGSVASGQVHLDLVTANHDDGTVSVLLGNGDGTFQPSVSYPAGTGPVALVALDTCSSSATAMLCTSRPSGTLDLAVVDQGSNSVSILYGNGDGTFQRPVNYPVGTFPSGIVAGDFNGDGLTDLAATNTNDNSISLLFGKGDGTFQSAQTIQLVNGRGPIGIASADFNGDTHADLAVAGSVSNTATVLLTAPLSSISRSGNTVSATLSSALIIPGGNRTGMVSIAGVTDTSFNGNFVVLTGSGTTTLTWTQTGPDAMSSGGLAAAQTDLALAPGAMPVAIVAANFDSSLQCTSGQKNPDIAVANQAAGTVSLFVNQCAASPDISFPSRSDFTVGNQPVALLVGDFNNDGSQDLAVANSADNNVIVLFGSGTGTFPANIPFQVGPSPAGLASGDFNGDGLADLAVTLQANNTVDVIINSQQLAIPQNQLPYPAVEYEDVGIKAKATPRLHPSGEVTITFSLEVRSISAVSFNGIPVMSNRSVEQTIRLRENEPGLISGLLSDQEILTFTGWPGTDQVPGLNLITGNQTPQTQQEELVIVVIPRAVRFAPHAVRELYAGYGRESSGAGAGAGTAGGEFTPAVPGQRFQGRPFTPGEEQPLIEQPAPGQPPLPVQPQQPPEQPFFQPPPQPQPQPPQQQEQPPRPQAPRPKRPGGEP